MEKTRIAEKMDREGKKIAQFFLNISELQMEIIVYHTDDQNWCIRDIISHFITSERSFLQLFENIKQGGNGTPDTFSIDEFNNLQILKMRGIEATLELSKSPNTKVIVIGSGSDGMPLILGNN